MTRSISRRDLLKQSAATAGGAVIAGAVSPSLHAQTIATEASPTSPALVQAATREGKLAFYTAMDLPVAEKFGKAFEAKFPGIGVRVERSGAERVFQRIGQEMESGVHAVDVVNSADG